MIAARYKDSLFGYAQLKRLQQIANPHQVPVFVRVDAVRHQLFHFFWMRRPESVVVDQKNLLLPHERPRRLQIGPELALAVACVRRLQHGDCPGRPDTPDRLAQIAGIAFRRDSIRCAVVHPEAEKDDVRLVIRHPGVEIFHQLPRRGAGYAGVHHRVARALRCGFERLCKMLLIIAQIVCVHAAVRDAIPREHPGDRLLARRKRLHKRIIRFAAVARRVRLTDFDGFRHRRDQAFHKKIGAGTQQCQNTQRHHEPKPYFILQPFEQTHQLNK